MAVTLKLLNATTGNFTAELKLFLS